MPSLRSLHFATILSLILTVLLVVSSVAGLLFGQDGLYDPDPVILPQLLGQDAITLLVGLPLLLVSMQRARRGSTRGLLLWAGAFFYFAYSYFFYVVGVRFNPLFLVYIAIVSIGLYGFLGLLFALDVEDVRARFSDRLPNRLIGGFLVAIALLFVLMWGGRVVSSLLAGVELDPVTRQVIVADGVVLLPICFFCGLWLWRRQAWGYALAGTLLVKIATLCLTLVVNTVLMALWGQPVDPALAGIFTVIMIGAGLLLLRYLRALPEQPQSELAAA